MATIEVKTMEQYSELIKSEKVSVLLFAVEWSDECKHILDVMKELSSQPAMKNLQFISIDAEEFAEASKRHEVTAVPTTIFFKQSTALERIDGVDIANFTAKCKKLAGASGGGDGEDKGSLEDRLKSLINQSKVMIFMKGDRDTPRCGFSKQLIAIVNETGVEYKTFDILTDEDVRQGLKIYSDWPTYPQVYVNGELIGGLDIIKELVASNELKSTLTN